MYIILISNNIEELILYIFVLFVMYCFEGEDLGMLVIVNLIFGYIIINWYYNDGIRILNWLLIKSINFRIFIVMGFVIILMFVIYVYI